MIIAGAVGRRPPLFLRFDRYDEIYRGLVEIGEPI